MTKEEASSSAPVSLKRTVLKTVATVGLTVLLIALLRQFLAALPWFDKVTGWHVGGVILQTLAADGIAKQQQMIAAGLMVLCFLIAVVLVRVGERLLARH